jgi:PKHD-type hydroxylase
MFKVVSLNEGAMDIVNKALDNELEPAAASLVQGRQYQEEVRKSTNTWVQDSEVIKMFGDIVLEVNRSARWNLNITGCEAIQYATYTEGDYFKWHVDQFPEIENNMTRKISMSLFLSNPDEYEGGELDLELYGPDAYPERSNTFRCLKGEALFFQSDYWHRVRPVKSGVRKSLVAWFFGPPFDTSTMDFAPQFK